MSLTDLLRDPELWRELNSIIANEREFGNDDGNQVRSDVSNRVFDSGAVENVFKRFVIDHLPQPSSVSAEELAENARQQLAGIPLDPLSEDGTFRLAVERFVDLSTAELEVDSPRYYGSAQVLLGHWVVDKAADPDRLTRFGPIWECKDFSLTAVATPSHDGSIISGYDCKLVGTLQAYCSQKALVAAEKWISKYAPSIAKTVANCTTRIERGKTDFSEKMEGMKSFIDRPMETGMPPDYPSPITFLTNKEEFGNKVFAACLDAVGRRHLQGNDTFTQRLGNCVHLLAEADRTDSIPVAITLCFAAIEAMLCDKPENVKMTSQRPDGRSEPTDTTVQIKKYIPTLLMPRNVGRSKRGAELYALYVARCDTIHGRKIAGHSLALHDIRQIAAGVIRSAISWCETRLGRGESADWESLFDVINCAAFGKSNMPDVPDLSDLLPSARRTKQYR